MSLGLGVEATVKVRLVGLEVAGAVPGVRLVVLVDAASGEDGDVNALEEAGVGQVEGADDVGAHGGLLVVLAPVDVGAAGGTGSVQDVGGLDPLELGQDGLAVLHADGGAVDLLALGLEERLEVTSHPAFTAPDKEAVGLAGTVGSRHCV